MFADRKEMECGPSTTVLGMLFAFFGTAIPTVIFIGEEGGPALYEEAIGAGLTVGGLSALLFFLYENNWSLAGAAVGGVEGIVKGVVCAL